MTNTFNQIHLQTDKRFIFERFTTLHALQANLVRADIHYALDKILRDFYLQLDVVRQLVDKYYLEDPMLDTEEIQTEWDVWPYYYPTYSTVYSEPISHSLFE